MPPRITARPSVRVSMVAYQRWSANEAGSSATVLLAGENSPLASGVLPPLMSSLPSPR